MTMNGKKITADQLEGLGQVIKMAFAALYPTGLTLEEIEALSRQRRWMARVYEYCKEKGGAA